MIGKSEWLSVGVRFSSWDGAIRPVSMGLRTRQGVRNAQLH